MAPGSGQEAALRVGGEEVWSLVGPCDSMVHGIDRMNERGSARGNIRRDLEAFLPIPVSQLGRGDLRGLHEADETGPPVRQAGAWGLFGITVAFTTAGD
jgi:hypothetical protein